MPDNEDTANQSNIVVKATAAIFVTVLAPVLVALGLKLVDQIGRTPQADTSDPKPAMSSDSPDKEGSRSASSENHHASARESVGTAPSPVTDSSGVFREIPLNADWRFFQTEPGEFDPKRFDFHPDGTILVSATGPKGILLRPTDYEHFQFALDWRYAPGSKASKAGSVLIRTGLESWPHNRLAVQILSGHIGKILAGKNVSINEIEYQDGIVAKAGEWHSMEITCLGSEVTVALDHRIICRAADCSRKSGRVGILVDSRDMEYRAINLTRLTTTKPSSEVPQAKQTPADESELSKDPKKSDEGRKKRRNERSSSS